MDGIRLHIFLLAINLSLVLGFLDGLLDNVKYEMNKGKHSIKNGERQPGDEQLFHDLPIEKGQKMKHVGNKYCYPPKSSMQAIKITSYEVKDLDKGSNGGVAFDVSGGVGQSQVCVYIKTQRSGSYHYQIDVFGYKLDNNARIIGNNMGGNNMGGMGVGNMGGMGVGNVGGFGANNYPPAGVGNVGGFGANNYPPAGGYGGGFGNKNAGGLGGYNNGVNGYGNSGAAYGNSGFGYGSGSHPH